MYFRKDNFLSGIFLFLTNLSGIQVIEFAGIRTAARTFAQFSREFPLGSWTWWGSPSTNLSLDVFANPSESPNVT